MNKKGFIYGFLLFFSCFFIIGNIKALTTSDNQIFPDLPNNRKINILLKRTNNQGYALLEFTNGLSYINNNIIYLTNNYNFNIYDLTNNNWVIRSYTANSFSFESIIASTANIFSDSNGSSVLYSKGYNLIKNNEVLIFNDTSGYYKNGFYFNQTTIDYIWNTYFEGKSYNYYDTLNFNRLPSSINNDYSIQWSKNDFPNLACQYMENSYFQCIFLEDLDNMNFSKDSNSYFAYSNNLNKYASYPGFKFTTSTGKVSMYLIYPSSFGYNDYYSSSWTTNFDVINRDTGVTYKNKVFDYNPNPQSNNYTVNFHLNGGNVVDFSNPLAPNTITLDYQITTNTEELEDYLDDITIFQSNFDFVGWYYDSNFTQPYTPGDTLSSNIDLYAKFVGPEYLDGYKKVNLTIDDKYVMISNIDSGSIFIPTNAFFEYGGRLSYYDNDISLQPYSSYIQDYTEMSDGKFVKQDFDLSTYNGSDWIMFSKYIYLEGEDNISYSIYVPNDAYIGEVSIIPNQLGGNDFDFTYMDENGEIQNGQVVSQDLSMHILVNDNPKLSNAFYYFTKPIRFIIQSITNLYNNYLSATLQKYFFILFTLVIVILLTRVIF